MNDKEEVNKLINLNGFSDSHLGAKDFQVIPAIDIINGKCVRLSKGDFSKKIVYHDDPLNAAKSFEDAGFKRLHMVDLDGAKAGSIHNLKVLKTISSGTKLDIDFSGGIKNINDVCTVFNAGASLVTLSSIAVKHPEIVEEWLIEFGSQKILIGADVLNEKIKISGWLEDGGTDIFEFIGKMIAIGVQNIFCTDISKDGMMHGPAIDLYKKVIQAFPSINLIASGGVSAIEDVVTLKETGCRGVIIGKAIYEGKIDLQKLAESQLV